MVNGVVGSNTRRKLKPEEFRGFALSDPLAPLVFVNGADSKAAQIFTLAHELAHLLLGESAVSDATMGVEPANDLERWCNSVASEFLVPMTQLQERFDRQADLTDELDRLAAFFRVSTLAVLWRVGDAGYLTGDDYWSAFAAERQRVLDLMGDGGSGGNYYNTQPVRVSKRFARALIESTLEGRTLYQDAFQMLGVKKAATFAGLAEHLGVT